MALTLNRSVAAIIFASALVAGEASAQTTLTLSTADTQVTDSTIGSGSAGATVFNTDTLTTRLSTDVSATRRALLKFDTETTIPVGTAITSARLTVFVKKGAGTATRRIGVYPITKSFQEGDATWVTRKAGYRWTAAGGDVGTKVGEMTVPATPGSAVSLDVTAAVRLALKDASSRYTRLELIDLSTADSSSYREFHSSETTDPSLAPKLVVIYGSAPPPPPPPVVPAASTTIKVLDWNTHYGMGTDGVYDINRIANTIVRYSPDVISLNEVTRKSHYSYTDDQPALYAQMLTQKTGVQWYYTYRTDNGATAGVGNIVLSKFPIASTSYCQLSTRRVAVNAAIYVNGRLINVWSTHLDSSTGNSMRLVEIGVLKLCVGSFAEQRIIAGDFNAKAATAEIDLMNVLFNDAWTQAAAGNNAVSYPGNTSFGATRNARIDYIFFSKAASNLVVKHAEVFDTRDSRGVMPSDHKPHVVTFEVK